MITLPLAPPVCNYHLQAVDLRCGVERDVCCESCYDVAAWLTSEGYHWTGTLFYRPPQGHHGKGLAIRILRGGRCGESLTTDEQRREILPHFAVEFEMV